MCPMGGIGVLRWLLSSLSSLCLPHSPKTRTMASISQNAVYGGRWGHFALRFLELFKNLLIYVMIRVSIYAVK